MKSNQQSTIYFALKTTAVVPCAMSLRDFELIYPTEKLTKILEAN